MNYLYLLFALLLATPALGDVTLSGGVTISGGVSVPAASGLDCTGAIFCEDFEGTPESTACDSGGTTSYPADSTTGASTTCDHSEGLAGSESAYISSCADAGEASINWFSEWDSSVTSGTVRARFLWQLDSEPATPASNWIMMFQFMDGDLSGTNEGGKVQIRQTDHVFIAISGDWGASDIESGTSYTVGETYRVCVDYDIDNDQTTVYRNTTAEEWCSTQRAQTTTSASLSGTMDGHSLVASYSSATACANYIYDDVIAEDL